MKPLSLNKPHLILMVGIPGSGKSFFAEHFSDTFKAPYVNFGRIRQELFNDPTYDNDEQIVIGRIADYMLDQLFKTKQTIIYEGQANTKSSRQAVTKKAKDNGYETLIIWVQTESVAAKARATRQTAGQPFISSDLFEANLKRFNAPGANEKIVVISGKHTFASQLKIVLSRLVTARIADNDNTQPTPRTAGGHRVTIR